MSPPPFARLGAYEILGALGAGGMGEVYRARDTRLHRDIAIKILPEAYATDPASLARFTREAQTLAALNHPNIAHIHGLEELGAVRALVMELVEGEDLSQRLARGALTVDEALPIARQIADALEAAHEQGIVHRDLKPANIKLRADGTVKVLDFGLAKVIDPTGGSVSAETPTMTSPAMTEAGVILGTAAYMSPEQARGERVDRRADIWAFGAVLYEMLTGRRVFTGHTFSDMVAAVLRDDVDWSALPAGTPDAVRSLLARCLNRDTKKRLQAIGEARVVLEEATVASSGNRAAPAPVERSSRPPLLTRGRSLAMAAILVLFAAALFLWQGRRATLDTKGPAQTGRSIAVLPFVNSSGNPDDEYLADGMTDELIAGLGKVPGLHVAARTSAFSFKGQKVEIRDVAQKLSVDSILEGTVRRSGKRLRVTASLVNAADGLQLWASTFENDTGDAFSVQDEVTRGVLSRLALQLGEAGQRASQAGRTKDLEAHDLYLRGLALMTGSEIDLRRALEYYQQAIVRDPGFALAYAGIGWAHLSLADAYVAPSEAYPKVAAAANAALERSSQLADAHTLLAHATAGVWGDPTTVDREFKRALEVDPNSLNARLFRGVYSCFWGQLAECLADLDWAEQHDPLSPLIPHTREIGYYVAKRYAAVIEAHKRTEALDPTYEYFQSWTAAAHRELGDYPAALREYASVAKTLGDAPQYGLALTYVRMGREQDAREIMRQLDEHAKARYVPFVTRAMVHAALGDLDTAVALLQQGIDKRESYIFVLRSMPEMAPLVKDSRARRIIEQADVMRKSK